MKNKAAFFEIPASNFSKAKKFYEAVFDWKVELWATRGHSLHDGAG
jgi:predicted enzyme related to lactoylglutathione lyase